MIKTNSWQTETLPHLIQSDSFNCGVYVLHFFEKLVGRQNLTDSIDIDQYRRKLKLMLVYNSMPVNLLCFYCGTMTHNHDFECRICHRRTHLKCLSIEQSDEKKMQNIMCDLCRQN